MRAFVIAMPAEFEAVRAVLGADAHAYVSGIGKVNAAAATQRALDAGATEIWNCGLCGGFGETVTLGGVYEVTQAVEYDFDLADLNGTRVGQLDGRDSPYLPCVTTGRFPEGILASGDRFNDRDDDLGLFRELGCTLRDMEGAAIAHVCADAHVPCRLLKCVSDVHGRGAMTAQYVDNREACLRRLAEACVRWLEG